MVYKAVEFDVVSVTEIPCWAIITEVVITDPQSHVGPERIHQTTVALIGKGPGLLGIGNPTGAKREILSIENTKNSAHAAANEGDNAGAIRKLQDKISEDRELEQFGVIGSGAFNGTDAVVMKAALGLQGHETRELRAQSDRAAEAWIELYFVAGDRFVEKEFELSVINSGRAELVPATHAGGRHSSGACQAKQQRNAVNYSSHNGVPKTPRRARTDNPTGGVCVDAAGPSKL